MINEIKTIDFLKLVHVRQMGCTTAMVSRTQTAFPFLLLLALLFSIYFQYSHFFYFYSNLL
jgi:hypothetical protein